MNNRTPGMIWAIVLVALQILNFATLLIGGIAAPGYMLPFLNNPVARIVLLLLVLWQAMGLVLLVRLPYKTWLAILIAIVFSTPLSLAPMLGPAVVTIITALGPVMTNQKDVEKGK